jgi:hypothetical protein
MRTTSQGTAFKKATQQSKSGLQSRDDSPIMYNEEMEATELAQFDNTEGLS